MVGSAHRHAPSSTQPLLLVVLQQVLKLLFLLAAVCGVILVGAQQSQRQISTQELDRVLKNDILLNFYIKCMLDKGTCDPDGRELRKALPQALSSGCSKCSTNQRQATERVIRHLRAHRPRDWMALKAKFDPKGEYEKKYGSLTAAQPAGTKAPKPTASSKAASPTAMTSSKVATSSKATSATTAMPSTTAKAKAANKA